MPEAEDGLDIIMEHTQKACATSAAVLKGLSDMPGYTFLVLIQRCGDALKDSSVAAAMEAADLAQEMAWEKLHTGNWKDVSLDWRNGYSLACLLAAAASLLPLPLKPDSASPRSTLYCPAALSSDVLPPLATQLPDQSMCAHSTSSQSAEGWNEGDDRTAAVEGSWLGEATLARALLQLDLAAMMGGSAFRPHVDACIQAVQSMLHGCAHTSSHPLQPSAQACIHPLSTSMQPIETSPATLHACHHPLATVLQLSLASQPELQANGHAATISHLLPHPDHPAMQPSLHQQRRPPGTADPTAAHPSQPRSMAASEAEAATLLGSDRDDCMADAARKRRRVSIPASPDRSLPAGRQQAASEGQASGVDAWPSCTQQVPLPEGSLLGSFRYGLPVLRLPSFERFLMECMCCGESGQPAVLTGAMEGWPAMNRWHSPAYLSGLAGLRTIPVELGRHYLADGWGQRLMRFSDFLCLHMLPAASDAVSQVGYLAQHPLFEQIPELKADIAVPEYCALGNGELQSINAWLGPAGTVTPLHHDPHHNLLAQVVGSKYVRLYPPSASAQMCPHTKGMTTNASSLDLDLEAPQIAGGGASEPFWDCVLKAGHMLYIPPGWWHYVKAASISISVSFWWQ